MRKRGNTPFREATLTHFVKAPKAAAPTTSWWTEPTTREEFHAAAQQRDQVMGWSHGSQGRELKTMYEEWRFTK